MSTSMRAGRRWSAWSKHRGVGIATNWRNNPMQSRLAMHRTPRCRAQTRSATPCRSPAMTNGRCRMHGGKSTGAPIGNTNARKHGRYTAEAIAERRELVALLRSMRGLVENLEG
ncbi:MAG: HGGxSTG domain-containing protein [Rhodospirillales bacterium]